MSPQTELALVAAGSNRVRELLDLLSEKPREIIIFKGVLWGFQRKKTAEIVGSTPGAVRVAQHRALGTLRKAIAQENE